MLPSSWSLSSVYPQRSDGTPLLWRHVTCVSMMLVENIRRRSKCQILTTSVPAVPEKCTRTAAASRPNRSTGRRFRSWTSSPSLPPQPSGQLDRRPKDIRSVSLFMTRSPGSIKGGHKNAVDQGNTKSDFGWNSNCCGRRIRSGQRYGPGNASVSRLLNKANSINYEEIEMAKLASDKAGDNQALLTFAKTMQGRSSGQRRRCDRSVARQKRQNRRDRQPRSTSMKDRWKILAAAHSTRPS